MNKVPLGERPWTSLHVQQIGLAVLYIGLAGLHAGVQNGSHSSEYISTLLFAVCSMLLVLLIGGSIVRDMIRAEEKRMDHLKQRLIVMISCAIVVLGIQLYVWIFILG